MAFQGRLSLGELGILGSGCLRPAHTHREGIEISFKWPSQGDTGEGREWKGVAVTGHLVPSE